MRFIKPVWLTHSGEKKDFEVYSCHVSPDGSRLATAAGDGHVRVWSTEAIYNAGDPSYSKPKQLASMSTHSGTIHTVRFSPNNQYLASGADDKIVCVYNLDPNPPSHSTFGSNEAPPTEHWRVFRRLIGHDNDVQDLGWSYDSSILVTVGLDSKVVVWSGHTFEKLKTLLNHQSHVKGLAFDPANKYFATASDDRSIKIFRFTSPTPNTSAHDQVGNFMIETSIVAPFIKSPLTTYFRRCSWSPDGNHIAAPNAVNGPVPCVAIVNRGNWDSDINLIGHEAPVEVCAFSPRLFAKEPSTGANQDGKGFSSQHLVTVIACAGQDKTLTVWNTSHPRPVVITQELAKKSISDLAWSPDGQSVFVTSLDGSIVVAAFEDGELGYAVKSEENEKALAKFGAARRGVGIVEGTDGLVLEDMSKAGEITRAEGRMGELMGHDSVASGPGGNVPLDSQAPQTALNGIGGLAGARASAPGSMPMPSTTVGEQRPVQADSTVAKAESLKQRVTITKDGKKRIAPLLLTGSSGAAQSSLPSAQLLALTAGSQGSKNEGPFSVLDLSKPYDGLPKGGLSALLLGNRRRPPPLDADAEGRVEKRLAAASRNGSTPIMTNGIDGVEPARPPSGSTGMLPTPDFMRPAVVNPSLSVSQVRLAVPKVRSHIVRGVDRKGNVTAFNETSRANGAGANVTTSENAADQILEIKNAFNSAGTGRLQDREPAKVAVTKRGQVQWQDFLPRNVLLVTGNQNMWAAACEEGSVYTWTPAGRRILNALVLEAQPVILESRGWWLLCITAAGLCHVWNLRSLSSPHAPVSLAPVLDIAVSTMQAQPTIAPAVTAAYLNSRGNIIVSLNTGESYTYSSSMCVWQRLSEPWWAVGSQYWNTADSSLGNLQASSGQQAADVGENGVLDVKNVSAGVIPHLERHTTNEVLVRGRGYHLQRLFKSILAREGYEAIESIVSIGHLENRLAAAMQLGAREEFRLYLHMYAKRIGAEGLRGKVDELLKGLTGSLLSDGESDEKPKAASHIGRGWAEDGNEICGWDRLDLLKAVVLILGKHRDLQRLTVPYARLVGVTESGTE
ncbi:MAG: HIR complex subunit [Caeruleum heppii]|nr:MAG: HIR complex subunit [Caeruleum heppii]